MRKGAKSFAEFSAFTVPAVIGFVCFTGSLFPLIAMLGVFCVLQFANHLDRNQ